MNLNYQFCTKKMNLNLFLDNITNPALLFFFLGIIASQVKSDLKIPDNSSKFISIYLMFAIGFKGGQELAHSEFTSQVFWAFAIGIISSLLIPVYVFFILKPKYGIYNSVAIAAAYGSISAVTFVTAVSFLELQGIHFDGFMVAVMAAPAIIIAFVLLALYNPSKSKIQLSGIIKHSLTNGSVLLLIGSLFIGFLASEDHARGIEPFTTDIFKGFLVIFLLDMGINSGKYLKDLFENGKFSFLFSILIPLINGVMTALISSFFLQEIGNRLLLSVLVSSASYIAVPAAMRLSVPQANQGLYVPMALAITFPFNICIGIPLYLYAIQLF